MKFDLLKIILVSKDNIKPNIVYNTKQYITDPFETKSRYQYTNTVEKCEINKY